MTRKQLVKDIINHKEKNKLGWQFYPNIQDNHIGSMGAARLMPPNDFDPKYYDWGDFPEIKAQLNEEFDGEVRYDAYGNIYGRLNGVTKGECIKGALDNWDDLKTYEFPKLDLSYYEEIKLRKFSESEQYMIAGLPVSIFSTFRDSRLMANALMDVVLEPELIQEYLEKLTDKALEIIDHAHECGADAAMMCDDWGTQDRTFISPDAFREIFMPSYKKLTDRLHGYGMHFILHSCGYNYAFMDAFIEAGIDVLQFDQLGLYGYQRMADEFASKVTFWAPVDIQRTLPTGNRELIEAEAWEMINTFKGVGGLLVKDYPSYHDIGVEEEWATWARDIFVESQK